MQYFRAWLRLNTCEERCPQASLIRFLEEFGANDQALRQTVQGARLFFQLTATCPFFTFMKPSAVTRVGRRPCQTCTNDEGFLRNDPVATYQTFDITLPIVPERDESLASLVRDHFNSTVNRECANCNSVVTTTNSTYLVNAQRAVVINLLRFNNNPNWTGNMRVGQGEGPAALKNKRRVDLAHDIVIPGYNVGVGESYTYQLVSTCEHIGEVINDGHYVAHILSRENTWWRANDNQPLEKSKMADVESSTVFLLRLVDDEDEYY